MSQVRICHPDREMDCDCDARVRSAVTVYLPSITFQCPPLSGPIRVNFPVDLNSCVARSMVRSDFPSRVAISGIESSGASFSRSRTFPDVFPDVLPKRLRRIVLPNVAFQFKGTFKSAGRTKRFVSLFQVGREHIFDPFHECADPARQVAPMRYYQGDVERLALKLW